MKATIAVTHRMVSRFAPEYLLATGNHSMLSRQLRTVSHYISDRISFSPQAS